MIDLAFDESQHPRDADGKFGDGEGARHTSAADLQAEPLPATRHAAEDRIRHEANEHVYLLRADGSPIVGFGSDALDHVVVEGHLPELANAILTHNHPRDSGLSIEDGHLAFSSNLQEIRAVVSDGTWSLRRLTPTWPTNAVTVVDANQARVHREFETRIKEGAMTTKQANASHHNEVWSRFARDVNHTAGRNVVIHSFEPRR